jgi:ATP-dependent RNA helicase RhlE
MKFQDYNISEDIKRTLDGLGFRKPTDIQYKAIPSILQGEDVLAIAQTGTGKTAAFAIPIIDMLHRRKTSSRSTGIRCLVMAPTRELAMQIAGVFDKLARFTKVKTLCVVGGVEQDPQIKKLVSGVDILIATPGRLFDLANQRHLDYSTIEMLILDEADHMLDLGFIGDIRDLIRFLPKKRQTLFFSATISPEIKVLAYSLVNKPVRIQISPKDPVSRNVDHAVAFVEMDDKRFFLERLVREYEGSKILVFVRTQVRAERVKAAMERAGIASETIHGGKDQIDRSAVLDSFRSGQVKLLIATDITARGIDIPGVEYVVNYDMPEVDENYVHRVGRTGRGDNRGKAVSFCSKEELPVLKKIEDYLGNQVKEMVLTKNEYEDTLDISEARLYDWKSLLAEDEKRESSNKDKIKAKAVNKTISKNKIKDKRAKNRERQK